MRKTVFASAKAAALASFAAVVFATVLTACASGPSSTDETNISAARLVGEGLLYERRFSSFASVVSGQGQWQPKQPKTARAYTAGSGPSYEEPSIPEAAPSEKDIDSAIERYQAALKLAPSGTWSFGSDARSSSWYSSWMNAPEKNVKVLLEDAKKTKQSITALVAEQAKQQQTQQAAQTAQTTAQTAQTAQQTQASTGPNDPYDFDIMQNADGGITITKYKGSRYNVIIPSTISGLRVTRIGDVSFGYDAILTYRNDSLQSVVIPNTVTSIGRAAFNNCIKLSSVTMSTSLITIGEYAFRECPITSIALPNSITTIEAYAFSSCRLTSITLPNRITKIGRNAFWHNELTTVQLPDSLKEIGEGAFADNPLTTIVIPPSLTRFGRAFFKPSTLTSITLPANVDDWSLDDGSYGNFETSFINYYKLQGKKAGTYVKVDRIWRLQ